MWRLVLRKSLQPIGELSSAHGQAGGNWSGCAAKARVSPRGRPIWSWGYTLHSARRCQRRQSQSRGVESTRPTSRASNLSPEYLKAALHGQGAFGRDQQIVTTFQMFVGPLQIGPAHSSPPAGCRASANASSADQAAHAAGRLQAGHALAATPAARLGQRQRRAADRRWPRRRPGQSRCPTRVCPGRQGRLHGQSAAAPVPGRAGPASARKPGRKESGKHPPGGPGDP